LEIPVIMVVTKTMSKKRNDKKIMILEPAFQDILVCRDPQKRPNMEIFVAEPENIFQENLGKIAGIFEIIDNSEDSSYVVNYLISVIKKEYFSHPKRGAVESLEAALHKTNLALSKLASHGNVSWIGNLNAVITVIEKNNLHISQTGTACALLLRSNMLTNLSEGGEKTPESNPLKTFQDVLSGRMEKNDKIIFATDSIFEIFSPEEIKKSALKFSKSDFIQFLNTALVNELELASVLIVDISEKEEEEMPVPQKSNGVNAFSQTSFKKIDRAENVEKKQEEKREIIEEIKEEFKKTQDGFVDKKTGHIYIKDKDAAYERSYSKMEYISSSKDRVISAGEGIFSAIKNKFRHASLKFKNKPASYSRKVAEARDEKDRLDGSPIVIKEEVSKEYFSFRKKIFPATISTLQNTWYFLKKYCLLAIKVFLYKIFFPAGRMIKNLFLLLSTKIRSIKKPATPAQFDYPDNRPAYQSRQTLWQEKTSYLENRPSSGISISVKPFLPSLSRLKSIVSGLSNTQRIYAILVLVVIIIVPYFIVRYEKNSSKENVSQVQEPAQNVVLPLEHDTNVARIENLNSLYQGSGILSQVSINGKNFAVKSSEIVSTDDNKNYPIPDGFSNADLVTQMDDLSFIFLIKDKKIISFSASAGKFQDNNISMPDGITMISARSYLTYLYILDGKNNQIYRYPRAEGGFGEKTNWLKDTADFVDAKDMAINDNIYVTDGKQISKFFRGKKQAYSVEQSATAIIPDRLYAKPTSENLYVLDKINSRVIKLDKDGKILAQYYNADIGNTKNFAVDEEANMIYVSGDNNIKSFNIST
jgi:hypothetical protein